MGCIAAIGQERESPDTPKISGLSGKGVPASAVSLRYGPFAFAFNEGAEPGKRLNVDRERRKVKPQRAAKSNLNQPAIFEEMSCGFIIQKQYSGAEGSLSSKSANAERFPPLSDAIYRKMRELHFENLVGFAAFGRYSKGLRIRHRYKYRI